LSTVINGYFLCRAHASTCCIALQVTKASKYGLPVKTAAGEIVFQPTRKQQLTAAKVQVEGIQVEDTLQSEKAQKAAEKEAAAAEAAERRAAAAAEKQAAAKAAAAAEAAAKKGEVCCLVLQACYDAAICKAVGIIQLHRADSQSTHC
jgi:colicin import membrane protein